MVPATSRNLRPISIAINQSAPAICDHATSFCDRSKVDLNSTLKATIATKCEREIESSRDKSLWSPTKVIAMEVDLYMETWLRWVAGGSQQFQSLIELNTTKNDHFRSCHVSKICSGVVAVTSKLEDGTYCTTSVIFKSW